MRAMVLAGLASSMIFAGAVAQARAQTYKQIYSFRGGRHGSEPYGSLVEFRGRLFGTTALGGLHNGRGGYGTVFALDPTTGKKTTIYIFQGGNDGANPYGGLTLVGDVLYGTTSNGGAANAGTVFSVDPKTHAESIVHTFQGGNDGSNPSAALLYVTGTFYGTSGGGAGSAGTVFSIDTATGAEKIVHAFQGDSDGYQPYAGLIDVGGLLYGTTAYGGASGAGTAFSVDPATGSETILHSFGSRKDDGRLPLGGLTAVSGKLYGTTDEGGSDNEGTVFWIEPATGAEKVVYSFTFSSSNPADGGGPSAGLTDVHGTLYGTTYRGGSQNCGFSGCGTVFAFDIVTNTETILYAFQGGSDGQFPQSSLTDVGGTLYGSDAYGGTGGTSGTVFEIVP